jgi:hypothetical protein
MKAASKWRRKKAKAASSAGEAWRNEMKAGGIVKAKMK